MQKNAEQRKLFVVSGSSGVGKNTLINQVLERNPKLVFSISCTTRDKREGEVEGVNYFYISKEEFKKSVENGEFLEWAEFSGNYYGTKRAFVDKCLNANKDIILEIDTQGALQIKEKMPESVLIFIEPPSYEDLEFRLRNRKTETEESIAKRLEFVKLEIQNAECFDYRVVNDKLEDAVRDLESILRSEGAY